MADLVLGPLMQILIDKLASPILQKFQDRHNLKDNIRKLQQSVPRIQALLEDAQRQQQTRHDVKQWLAELEDAACESEALLDELAAEVEARERRTTKGKEVPGLMFFPFKPSDYLFDLASQLQIKLRELDQIAEQATSFDLQHKALAVIALASLLRSKKEEYWMSVQDSELWQFEAYQSAVMPALKLSYQYLPSHLKRCLAFFSLFPKDHAIPRDKMIYIWMAHGLILPDGGTRQLEVIGGEYFDDLLSLSFFQEVQKHEDGSPAVYKMHDLIHDLVRTVAGYGFSVLSQGLAPVDLERIHHLSMVSNFDPSSLPEGLFGAKHLRTLLLSSPGGSPDKLTPFWPVNFIYLKVLDLSGYGLKTLDDKISALLCLRYLDLSSNPIQTLPRTICDLYFLQTLNLFECQHLVELPSSNIANIYCWKEAR